MTQQRLIVHAGLKPGELFIQHADRDATSMIILPAAVSVATFVVNEQDGEYWLVRQQANAQNHLDVERFLSFKTYEDAQEALLELTSTLMQGDNTSEAAEIFNQAYNPSSPPSSKKMGIRSMILLAAALLGLIAVYFMLENKKPDGAVVTPVTAAQVAQPTGAPAAPTPDGKSVIDAAFGSGSVLPPPPMPAAPPVEPIDESLLTPGDAFTQKAVGPSPPAR